MPQENITVLEGVSTDVQSLKDKVVRLTDQLNEVKGQKKSANKGFNDAIKDIESEIKDTVDLIKGAENA